MNGRRILVLSLLISSTAIAQTQPSENELERRSERVRIESESAALPEVRAESVDQALRLTVESDMLQAHSTVRTQEGSARVLLPALKGTLTINVFGPRAPELGGGVSFDFLQQDLTDPATGQVYTRVSAYVGRVSISRDAENDQAFSSIQLLQDAPPTPGTVVEELPVRLYVHHADAEERFPPLNLKLEASSFMLMRIVHLAETDRYLRPILRDLHQERSLLGIPDSLAWVALGPAGPTDPAMIERIKPLVARLDADDYKQRTQAKKELTDLGRPAALALASLDRDKLSLQQRTEIANLLEQSLPVPEEELRGLGTNPSFVLDMLYTQDKALESAAKERLAKLTGKSITLPPTTSPSDRDAAIARLRDQLLPPTTQPWP